MDNYYLNNAVYLVEEFLESTRNPAYGGEVAYGDRAEHCWNGDPTRPNATSRLRYHQMFLLRIVERIRKSAPAAADVTSWRYQGPETVRCASYGSTSGLRVRNAGKRV